MTAYIDLTTNAEALPTIVAAQALGALSSNMALMRLVNRNYDNEVASYGQTLNIPIRGSLTANAKSEGSDVTINAPTYTKAQVVLNQHYEVTFGEEDISIMLSRPDSIEGYATDAVIVLLEKIEATIAALYATFAQSIDATAGLAEDDFREAQRLLNSAKAPMSNRWAVLHEDAFFEAQGIERIVNRDYAESLGSIAADRYQGRAYGFNIFLDQNIAVATAECKNLFGHPDSIVFVTRPMRRTSLPTVAQATMAENGVVLRVTRWYNAQALSEQLTMDVLWGVAEMRDNHAVVVRTTEI